MTRLTPKSLAATAAALAVAAATAGAVAAQGPGTPEPHRPAPRDAIGSATTFVTAGGERTTLRCEFTADPDLSSECGRRAADGDGVMHDFRERDAVRAYTRVIKRDGSLTHVLTDFVQLERPRIMLMQAVGVDNATVVCRYDDRCAQVRTAARKAELVDQLRAEGKLTQRLQRSLEGDDPYLAR